jgi:hypothetical protein
MYPKFPAAAIEPYLSLKGWAVASAVIMFLVT